VAQLPEELRVVVLLYDVEGYTHNEIADMMGINSGASRMRLLRARQLLRTMLPLERDAWEGRP
jgi:RNA polymerase sigma-70 factor (ECF subfamily)